MFQRLARLTNTRGVIIEGVYETGLIIRNLTRPNSIRQGEAEFLQFCITIAWARWNQEVPEGAVDPFASVDGAWDSAGADCVYTNPI
jgi:hypothetical protein